MFSAINKKPTAINTKVPAVAAVTPASSTTTTPAPSPSNDVTRRIVTVMPSDYMSLSDDPAFIHFHQNIVPQRLSAAQVEYEFSSGGK